MRSIDAVSLNTYVLSDFPPPYMTRLLREKYLSVRLFDAMK